MIMFNNNTTPAKKVITPEGIVMTPSWTETLLNLPVGGEITIDRHMLRPAVVRTTASKLNKAGTGVRFTVRTVGQDDAVTVTRIQ